MNKWISLTGFTFAALFSFSVWADDDPEVDEGAEKFDQVECVDNTTDECITDACQTSENIDCEANCKQMAQDKCQEAVDE